MKPLIRSLLILAISLTITATAFSQTENTFNRSRAVFVMTNDSSRNQIIAYKAGSDGSLSERHRFATGGRGSGGTTDPLGSQGSLTLSDDGSLLFAVNAGSGELSVFRVFNDVLWLTDIVPCGGSEPVAVTQHGNLVYLVNAGGTSNVVGFRLDRNQRLRKIQDANAVLSTGNSSPGAIAFSPDGRYLLITEKATNKLDAFRVQGDGTLAAILSNPSAGPGTFATVFAPNGAALVVETGPAGGSNASAISSYSVSGAGMLSSISTSVPTLGAATCWVEVTPNGRFVYTANSASSTISGFAIGRDGSLTAVAGTVLANLADGSTDIDFSISSSGKFLYTLNTGTGTIGIFGIEKDGTLNSLGEVAGLPAKSGFNGIAAN
jgi:6-phosphogluconolactonase